MESAVVTDRQPSIVVIDDSPTSISLYERSSEPLDVALHTFMSPKQSVAFLRENPADLICLDVLTREKDGLSVLREIRKLADHADTPVVIITSKDYAQDRIQARELGAADYLLKPLRSQEIREIICQHTDAKPKTNQ